MKNKAEFYNLFLFFYLLLFKKLFKFLDTCNQITYIIYVKYINI